jgi:phospholipid/cholesterol/gamma-HCH transport system ATP-binding protein
VAFKIADRVAMLYGGHIVEQGTPYEFQQSTNPIVQQFIEGRAAGPLTE